MPYMIQCTVPDRNSLKKLMSLIQDSCTEYTVSAIGSTNGYKMTRTAPIATKQRTAPTKPRKGRAGKVAAGLPTINFDKSTAKQAMQSGASQYDVFLRQIKQQGAANTPWPRKLYDNFLKTVGKPTSTAPYHISKMVKAKAIKKIPGASRAQTLYQLAPDWQG